MKAYDRTLRYLYNLQFRGIKVGLENTCSLLRFLGNPESQYPCVHIAGTNGKGSTASMIASILTATGYRTGLYTSPHLINFTERIRIDGKKITAKEVVRYMKHLKPMIEKRKATFFEATTALAFQYFADERVDIAVIETGLGGRFDATNVVRPLLSIITNIGLEHTDYLGSTHSRIAFEKGGIIKSGVPCLTGTKNQGVARLLGKIARSRGSVLFRSEKISSIEVLENSLRGLSVRLRTDHEIYEHLFVPLPGDHQAGNIQLAILAAEYLRRRGGFRRISKKSIKEGLSGLRKYSGIRGRMDVLKRRPMIIADVAHNPDAMASLVASLKKLLVNGLVAIFGVMKDKDYWTMLTLLSPACRLVVAVRPSISRALKTAEIVRELHAGQVNTLNGESVGNGLGIAFNEVRDGEAMLITGSHYVVGEAFEMLGISS